MSEEILGKVLASNLLVASAGKSAATIDGFTSWLLAGFGAAIAFLLGNMDSVSPYIAHESIKLASILFLIAAIVAVVEKFLSVVVVGAAEAGAKTSEIIKSQSIEVNDVVLSVVLGELKSSVFPPMRWFVAKSFSKMERGDLAASGRNLFKCVQIQGLLSLLISVLLLWSAAEIVCGLSS